VDSAICSGINGWFPPPHGFSELRQRFGAITVVGEKIIDPRSWESANMIHVDDLPLVGRHLYVNRLIVPMLRAALQAWADRVPEYPLKSIGCFAPRSKRSQSTISTHSWGIAVDVNADDLPAVRVHADDRTIEDAKRAEEIKARIPVEVVDCFRSVGFTWGGDFHSYVDPMHFQFCSGY
jgi:hypothetical protein